MVVAGIVAEHGVDGLFMCTMMAGVMLVAARRHRAWARRSKYLPRPVVIGFTNGIAVLIASTQIKDFFGLGIDAVPAEFARADAAIWRSTSSTVSPAATAARRRRARP